MASNFTENFGLNQWERSDKVLMEDFNADNAKIDTALAALNTGLAGKAGAWELIGEHQISSSSFGGSTVDFTSRVKIDWNEWDQVVGLGKFESADADSSDTILIEGYLVVPEVDIFTIYNMQMGNVILAFFPHHNPSGFIKGLAIGHGVSFFSPYKLYKNLEGVQFRIQSGSNHRLNSFQFRFFGRR